MSVDQVNNIQLGHINNCAMQQMQSNSSVANRYGVKLVAYEGGESLVGYGGAENNTALTSLFGAASRSSQMTSLYGQYFQNWVNAGGDLFVHYTDVAPFSKWGNFGTLEYQDQDLNTAPKYQALRLLRSSTRREPTGPDLVRVQDYVDRRSRSAWLTPCHAFLSPTLYIIY